MAAVLCTLLPLVVLDYWWIRIFDFPHVQLTGFTLFALLIYFIRFDIKSFKDYLFVSVLAGCFTFQMLKIYKYTPLFTVEANSSTIVEDSNTLKLFSANVLQKNKDYQIVLNQISEKNPDVVLLMETDQTWKNAIHTHLAEKYPYQLLKPLDNTYGMLFYSQLPISNQKIRFLVDEEIPSMEAVVTLPGGAQFQLYAIHPTPPMPQHSPMSSDRDTEMMQTAFTITDREIPVIVVGDFNDVPWSRTTSLFRKVSRLLDPRIGRGFFNTFNAKNIFMRWPLDYVFISEEFRVKTFGLTESINSDHFPLYAEFTFEPEQSEIQLPEEPDDDEIRSAKDQMKKQNLLVVDIPDR